MNQISQQRAFFVTERFTQKPIKLTVARPTHLGYALSFILRLVGVKNI